MFCMTHNIINNCIYVTIAERTCDDILNNLYAYFCVVKLFNSLNLGLYEYFINVGIFCDLLIIMLRDTVLNELINTVVYICYDLCKFVQGVC